MGLYQNFPAGVSQDLPQSSIADTTPPTFAGITSVVPNTDGSFTVSYSAASDVSLPVRYQIYMALGTVSAAVLFQDANIVSSVTSLTSKVFMLPDWATYIVNGLVYTLGVRSVDAVGNVDTNTAVLTSTAIGSGNLPTVLQTTATQLAATEALLAQDVLDLDAIEADLEQDELDLSNTVAALEIIVSSAGASAGMVMTRVEENRVISNLETYTTVMTIEDDEVV